MPMKSEMDGLQNILSDIVFNKPSERLFRYIGEFVYQFSQLEYLLRILMADAAKLEDKLFDSITSNYDFRSLCAVVKDLLLFDKRRNVWVYHGEAQYNKLVFKFVNDCLAINDIRVKVVHGTWTTTEGARHVSRQKFIASYAFEGTGSLRVHIDNVKGRIGDAVVLLGRDTLREG